MTTMKEQMQERMDQRPDAQTLAWWDSMLSEVASGYRGLTHAVNLVLAEIEDRDTAVKALRERVEVQADMLHRANVEIGKLQAEVTLLQESMEKAREAFAELKKKADSK